MSQGASALKGSARPELSIHGEVYRMSVFIIFSFTIVDWKKFFPREDGRLSGYEGSVDDL